MVRTTLFRAGLLARLFRDKSGATAAEYGVIASILALAMTQALGGLGGAVTDSLDDTTEMVGGGSGGAGEPPPAASDQPTTPGGADEPVAMMGGASEPSPARAPGGAEEPASMMGEGGW